MDIYLLPFDKFREYEIEGKLVKQFDFSKDIDEHEFTVAVNSPSGQSVVVGSYNR